MIFVFTKSIGQPLKNLKPVLCVSERGGGKRRGERGERREGEGGGDGDMI